MNQGVPPDIGRSVGSLSSDWFRERSRVHRHRPAAAVPSSRLVQWILPGPENR